MPETTRVYRFHQPGGPDRLVLESIPLPKLGQNEVRVRVQSMGLNRSDLLWLADTYIESPELPSRLGYEVAGIVEEAGPDVTAFRVGDRVSTIPSFSLRDYANFGETAVLSERGLIPTPPHLTLAQGGAFAFAYYTGYFALFEMAHLQPYQHVLVTAATSTTGLAGIALAKKVGAHVITTTRTSKKRDVLLAAGADHVIATDDEDLLARVMEITHGKGADVVYDCVGGSLSEKLARATTVRGRWIVYGILNYDPVPFPWLAAFIRSFRFDVYKVFDFMGNRNLGLMPNEPAIVRAHQFITGGLNDGSLPVTIFREFQGIGSLPDAFRYMASNQAAGKIIVSL
jgi:NADPH:quinone reductase-like Zn-dependent oxidoreductase